MKKLILLFPLFLAFFLFACQSLPIEGDFGPEQFKFVDQNNNSLEFPNLIKGKIGIVGYIFTNCPDICPLTTNNMRLIQEKLKKENINEKVHFVSISFDPETDSPGVLKKFAEVRNLDLKNWDFLTGEKTLIDSLIREVGVIAVVGDSSVTKDGEIIYYYIHTDRISLVDEDGKIRKNYLGSRIDIDEIIADVKKLL